jgi:hypothetical protein
MVVSWVQFVNVMRPNSKDVGSPTFVLAAWHHPVPVQQFPDPLLLTTPLHLQKNTLQLARPHDLNGAPDDPLSCPVSCPVFHRDQERFAMIPMLRYRSSYESSCC